MLYTSVERVKDTFPFVGSSSMVSDAHIAQAIDAEEAIINTALSHRYTVPISPTPSLLQAVATDLATLRLINTRLRDKANEGITTTLNRSWQILQKVSSGGIDLHDVDDTLQLANSERHLIYSTGIGKEFAIDEGDWLNMGEGRRAPKAGFVLSRNC